MKFKCNIFEYIDTDIFYLRIGIMTELSPVTYEKYADLKAEVKRLFNDTPVGQKVDIALCVNYSEFDNFIAMLDKDGYKKDDHFQIIEVTGYKYIRIIIC